MSLHQITYTSESQMPLDSLEEDLQTLQKRASANNKTQEISGVLIYRDGFFLQRIEGEKLALEALFKSIQRDSRHQSVEVISQGEIEERLYKDWTQMQLITKKEDMKSLAVFFALLVEKGARALSDEECHHATAFIQAHAS